MPFDFKRFDAKCANMSLEELQREWEHYTRLISGAATSTAVSGVAIPFTLGVSVIGVGIAAPAIHNARKKREIIERHLQRQGTTHNTRKRDVLTPMAISGTVGVVTLGVGSFGADAIANAGAEHGIATIVENELAVKAGTHLALDAAVMKGEDMHATHKKEEEALKALHKVNATNGKMAEAGMGIYPCASYNPQQSYAPVPIPQSYSLNSDSDSKSTYMGEKWPTYALHAAPSPSIPTTPAPQYSPPAYPGPPVQAPRVGFTSDSYFPPPPRSNEKASIHLPTPAYTPDLKSPQHSQAAPSYSSNPIYPPYNENAPAQSRNAITYYSQPTSTAYDHKAPQPEPAVTPQLEQQNQQPSQQPRQYCPPPVQTYVSYPATILPLGHPGQHVLHQSYVSQQGHPPPTSTIAFPTPGLTQPSYQPPQPHTAASYTLPPTTSFTYPPRQQIPSFPPPPRTPFTPASTPHPGHSPGAQQNINFPPPTQQHPYSPSPTPFSPYVSTSQPNGYFSYASQYPSPPTSSVPLHSYPTPAPTPYSEVPPEKQQYLQRPSITAQMFPPPPTSHHTHQMQY